MEKIFFGQIDPWTPFRTKKVKKCGFWPGTRDFFAGKRDFFPSNDSLDPGASFDEKKISVKLTPGPLFGPNSSKIGRFFSFWPGTRDFFFINDGLGPGASFGENLFSQVSL